MSILTTKTHYTPEDLLTMSDGDRYELVDGQLVERNMSMWSSYVAGVIYRRLDNYCLENRPGWLFPEGTTYQCFPAFPSMVRKADVSFIRVDRLTVEQAQAEGHSTVVPDFVVEVLSPNDLAYEVDEKVRLYLEAGVRLIWVVNPQQHTIAVHRASGAGTILHENDEVSGEEVIPGFRCCVEDFFVPPRGTPPG